MMWVVSKLTDGAACELAALPAVEKVVEAGMRVVVGALVGGEAAADVEGTGGGGWGVPHSSHACRYLDVCLSYEPSKLTSDPFLQPAASSSENGEDGAQPEIDLQHVGTLQLEETLPMILLSSFFYELAKRIALIIPRGLWVAPWCRKLRRGPKRGFGSERQWHLNCFIVAVIVVWCDERWNMNFCIASGTIHHASGKFIRRLQFLSALTTNLDWHEFTFYQLPPC